MSHAHADRGPHMGLSWMPWHRRVQSAEERTSRVEVETHRVELDQAERVARATLVTDRVERAALRVIADHEAVMLVAARERKGAT